MVEESSKLAECVGKTRSLLKKILSEGMDNCLTKLDNDPQGYLSQPLTLLEAVLQECHNTFTACFHSFYPTPALQWACLCDLLNCLDQVVYFERFFWIQAIRYMSLWLLNTNCLVYTTWKKTEKCFITSSQSLKWCYEIACFAWSKVWAGKCNKQNTTAGAVFQAFHH